MTTKANGISIHRSDCPNIKNIHNKDKLVDVKWNDTNYNKYQVGLYIETFTRQGSLLEILKPFYDLNIPIISSSSKTVNDNDIFTVDCEVKNLELLQQLVKEIYKVPEVLKVNRI